MEIHANPLFPSWMGTFPRANAPWLDTEESELLRGFRHEGLGVGQLAVKHGRRISGITERLHKLMPAYRGQEFYLPRHIALHTPSTFRAQLVIIRHNLNQLEKDLVAIQPSLFPEEIQHG